VDPAKKTNGLERFSGNSRDLYDSDWDAYLEELNELNPEDWK
jgi:hypothetical protein